MLSGDQDAGDGGGDVCGVLAALPDVLCCQHGLPPHQWVSLSTS